MSNYITLGPTPCEETCEPANGDTRKINKQLNAYIGQLKRRFEKFKNIKFVIKSFPHDFGTYKEVAVVWLNRDGVDEAHRVDEECPSEWDAEAIEYLNLE